MCVTIVDDDLVFRMRHVDTREGKEFVFFLSDWGWRCVNLLVCVHWSHRSAA
jgi:hypothetical protein